MFRGTTARTVLSLLAAALLAVQFFAPAATFAAAHTLSHVEAKAQAGPQVSAKTVSVASAVLRDHGRCGEPPAPPRSVDRHRSATAGWADARPATARHTESIRTPAPAAAGHHGTSRASRAHTQATLQVFRC
ncbi:hypothetical protein AB0M11_01320 [Streptomyces sp. NPDC051987]|uniref:hypothetical protein n=1 Tax=Streptomyces sp. NPDC051987 TaxID=3155808 RepID=UPI00343B71C5